METVYKFEKLDINNIEIAKKLCDRYVGEDLYEISFLKSIIDKPEELFYLIFKEEKTVGYFYCYYVNKDDLYEKEKTIFNESVKELIKSHTKIGIFRSIGIDEVERKHSLSDYAVALFEGKLKNIGCSIILAPCWKKDDYIPAKKLLTRQNYKYRCDILKPWKDNTTLKCPFCHKIHCECDASMFYKILENKEIS
ncbi:MAG: hypothetical protein RR073_03890 [Clostridia bacterium]